VKINSDATDGMEHFQMARQETRIVDIGLPNKRGNTITRQKLRPACRRFAWVNSRLWSDYELLFPYRIGEELPTILPEWSVREPLFCLDNNLFVLSIFCTT
jgi:hypothetical protein